MKQIKTQELAISALGMALVFLATYLIKIPNGIQGYFNLGDVFLMLFATFTQPYQAFLLGGIGSAMADLVGGYGMYAPATLLIKGLEAAIIAYAMKHAPKAIQYLSYLLAALIMVSGYFLADSFINQSMILGLSGIPANLLQAIIAIAISLSARPFLTRHKQENHSSNDLDT